jgi:hypothetical protein
MSIETIERIIDALAEVIDISIKSIKTPDDSGLEFGERLIG